MKLERDGLVLVPTRTELAEQVLAYYKRNADFLKEFDPKREEAFYTLEHQRKLLEADMEGEKRKVTYRFYIKRAESPKEIIGSISISNVVWGAFRSAFLGGKLDERYINRGYMTIATNLAVEYAFEELGLHRLEANVMPRNRRSLRVLEKCGFEKEGVSKYYLEINGVWEDHIHMVKLNYAMHARRE